MEECMTKELELTATTHMITSLEPDGHLVMLLDSFNQETLKSFELGKGLVDHDLVKTKKKQEACSSTACRQTKQQTRQKQMQLDQARLQEGQLRHDLSSQQKLEQENKQNNLGSNSLGTNKKSLGPACNNSSLGNNSLGIGDQQGCRGELRAATSSFPKIFVAFVEDLDRHRS